MNVKSTLEMMILWLCTVSVCVCEDTGGAQLCSNGPWWETQNNNCQFEPKGGIKFTVPVRARSNCINCLNVCNKCKLVVIPEQLL